MLAMLDREFRHDGVTRTPETIYAWHFLMPFLARRGAPSQESKDAGVMGQPVAAWVGVVLSGRSRSNPSGVLS